MALMQIAKQTKERLFSLVPMGLRGDFTTVMASMPEQSSLQNPQPKTIVLTKFGKRRNLEKGLDYF